jgi:hypothetical protein
MSYLNGIEARLKLRRRNVEVVAEPLWLYPQGRGNSSRQKCHGHPDCGGRQGKVLALSYRIVGTKPADVKSSAHQPFGMVLRDHPGRLEGPGHFVTCEQT